MISGAVVSTSSIVLIEKKAEEDDDDDKENDKVKVRIRNRGQLQCSKTQWHVSYCVSVATLPHSSVADQVLEITDSPWQDPGSIVSVSSKLMLISGTAEQVSFAVTSGIGGIELHSATSSVVMVNTGGSVSFTTMVSERRRCAPRRRQRVLEEEDKDTLC